MSEESTKAAPSSRSKRFLFMVVVPVLACLAGGAAWLHGGRLVETDNAYVKADLIQISPQVSGNIIHVNVRENQQVKKGDILFEIDAEPYQVAMEKAAANMAQVRTELSALKASYVEKQTELKLAESKLAYAQKEEVRQDNLLKKRYVSDADFDAAHQNVAIARLNVLAVKDDLKQIAESLGGSDTLPAEQHPDYLAAKATLAEALLDYKHTQILAPQDGVVRIPPKTGQYFAAGSQALSMVMNRQMWIEANYTETDLTWVKPGQQVTINVDTYPDHQWHGVVESLSPATSAEFSVLPAQNGTGNWVKIAQRLPVRIRIDDEPDLPLLRAGLSVIAEIDTQHQRSVLGLTLQMSAQPDTSSSSANRVMITLSVMLATIMQALDTTIANVALPHMQGSMSATQDQISWVLTSYIVAAAIFMPLTGLLSARFGRRRLFMWSVVGFTVASMLCGAAQNLNQIVIFRLLQGIFGASLVPLSQSVLLDTWPKEKHGQAMAMWGVGVMLGPILGPTLGGLLTEYYDWRWVFYINLPFGILAWFGLMRFVPETELDPDRRFDLTGFAMLALAIGALQMMLDRGESQDWFASREIVIEAALAALGMYLFIVHIFTHRKPFIEPAMFRDRNFSVGLLFIFIVGIILLATMALLPPFMQNLMGYPVVDVGYLLAPRGIGTMISMILVGRLSGKVDVRLMIFTGLMLMSYSLWAMTLFTADVSAHEIIRTGVIQGLGLGFVFVPLSTASFATLEASYRNEGTALFSLLRNIGSSIGISVVMTYLAQSAQRNHAVFAEFMSLDNAGFKESVAHGIYATSGTGLSSLNTLVTTQATTLAYLQDFRLMMWITLASVPLLLLMRPATAPAKAA